MTATRHFRTTLTGIAIAAFAVHMASAACRTASFETPNLSTQLAQRLVRTHEYAVPVGANGVARAIQLPGEPVYLAAGFMAVPASLQRFLHVPVVVAWITAIATVAFAAGGRRLSLLAALLVLVDPFVVVHGPVWDDTFLSAACEWLILAVLIRRVTQKGDADTGPPRWGPLVAVALLSAAATLTRTSSQIVLGSMALAAIAWPRARLVRAHAAAIMVGIVVALVAWGVRNDRVLGTFFIGSSHDGQTLWHANSPLARPALIETGVVQSYADLSAAAGDDELTADRTFRAAAFDYLAHQPADAFKTAVVKIFVSLTGFDFRHPVALQNIALSGWNLGLLALAVAGWRRALPTIPATRLLLAAAALTAFVTLAFLAFGPAGLRYRMTFAGFVYVGAALALRVSGWPRSVPADAVRV